MNFLVKKVFSGSDSSGKTDSAMKTLTCWLFALLCAVPCLAQDHSSVSANLALTPPMGWNSWNKFGCNVSD